MKKRLGLVHLKKLSSDWISIVDSPSYGFVMPKQDAKTVMRNRSMYKN